MADKNQRKDIQSKVIFVLSSEENVERGNKIELRVVSWISGTRVTTLTERREFFRGDDGDWKMGKAKGLAIKDLTLLQQRWPELMRAMGSKLPEHQSAPPGAAPTSPGAAPAAPAMATSAPEKDF